MDRRSFAQLLTLGAGSLGLVQASAQGQDDDAGAAPGAKPKAAGTHPELVNVADIKALAEATLPKATFDYITTGSADQLTLHENTEAFQRLRVYPPLMKGVSSADLSTTVLGRKIKLPVMLDRKRGQAQFSLAVSRCPPKVDLSLFLPLMLGHWPQTVKRESQKSLNCSAKNCKTPWWRRDAPQSAISMRR